MSTSPGKKITCFSCLSTLLNHVQILVPQALEVTIWRDGMEYRQKYSHGKPVTTLSCHVLPVEYKERQGTRIRFLPDKQGL